MADDAAKIKVLFIGLDAPEQELVRSLCDGGEALVISSGAEFEAQYDSWQDGAFNAVFCGKSGKGIAPFEIAQTMLNQCPNTPKFYVTRDFSGYEPRLLIKNGFSRSFLLPLDLPSLKRAVAEHVTSDKARKSFRSVRVFDLDGETKLEFDTFVFLPLNKKYVRFSGAGEPVSEKRLGKLNEKSMSSVFVDHKDMPKFYQYSANRLREMGDASGPGATERQEKLRDCVRGVFSDIFDASVKADFDGAKEMLENCSGIISNYVTKGARSDWYARLMSAIGESEDAYSHATNVASFAALFAIGLGHAHPEDLAMAGMFHDLGETAIPEEILAKADLERTQPEREMYWSHPEKSIAALKTKRMIVAPAVEKAIAQHHEAWHGRGYPKQLPAARISPEAQILSFADQFDYLTRLQEGRPRLAPLDAFEEIKRTGSINPEILSGIRKLLAPETKADGAKAS